VNKTQGRHPKNLIKVKISLQRELIYLIIVVVETIAIKDFNLEA